MSVEVVLNSPLAQALESAIQPKLIEVGWTSGGGDESSLSEYIMLLLSTGKTQDQIATELSGDLLNLGPDDPGARDFSQWLFEQVAILNSQSTGGIAGDVRSQSDTLNGTQDAEMEEASDIGSTNVYPIPSLNLSPYSFSFYPSPKLCRLTTYSNHRPTGPKSMRTGGSKPRDKRMFGQLAKAMDRSSDAFLHRRTQGGNERVNSHRAPPTGPRQTTIRGGARMMNNRQNNGMHGMSMPQAQAATTITNMSPQDQAAFYALFEQQTRLMAQVLGPEQQQRMMGAGGHFNPALMNGGSSQQSGRSLFDRVQANPHRPQKNFRKGPGEHRTGGTPSSSMDVEMSSQEKLEDNPELSPDTICKYNLYCTNKDCKFAHQSPAAKPGATIDVTDTCSFGAACKNFKCTGRHPSPAQKLAHATETECKFYPNCTNARCPFKHPQMPPCRNGADCTTENCKFAHSKIVCRFNPCLNADCLFKHADGQKRGKFEDKVWVADDKKEHVSERKFVDDEGGEEELILPGSEMSVQGLGASGEMIS
jgi:hypothetical protein